MLDHSTSDELASKWGLSDPWNIETAAWKMVVFYIPDKQSLPDHIGAENALSLYFSEILDSRFEIRVINLDGGFFPGVREVDDFKEALSMARTVADYFILLEFTETERTFSAAANLYIARTGEELTRLAHLRVGENRVLDTLNLLIKEIASWMPKKMSILAVDGARVLLDKGRWYGMESGDIEYSVLRKGSARPAITDGGLEYSPRDFLGTLSIQSVSESLGEGLFNKAGIFNFVSAGDEVFSIATPEDGLQDTTMPDPALRVRLLSVP